MPWITVTVMLQPVNRILCVVTILRIWIGTVTTNKYSVTFWSVGYEICCAWFIGHFVNNTSVTCFYGRVNLWTNSKYGAVYPSYVPTFHYSYTVQSLFVICKTFQKSVSTLEFRKEHKEVCLLTILLPITIQHCYRVSSSGGKAVGAWSWPPTPFYRRGRVWIELHIHLSSTPAWHVMRQPLPLSPHAKAVITGSFLWHILHYALPSSKLL